MWIYLICKLGPLQMQRGLTQFLGYTVFDVQLDSVLSWKTLSLTQYYHGQRSAWLSAIPDNAQLDSALSWKTLSLAQCYPGQWTTLSLTLHYPGQPLDGLNTFLDNESAWLSLVLESTVWIKKRNYLYKLHKKKEVAYIEINYPLIFGKKISYFFPKFHLIRKVRENYFVWTLA